MNRGLCPPRSSKVVCFVNGASKVSVKFTLAKKVSFGQTVALVGSKSGLGSWDPKQRLSLSWHDGHHWTVQAELPIGEQVEYKYVIVDDTDILEWQPGSNLVLKIPDVSTEVVVIDDWSGRHADVQVRKAEEATADPLVDALQDELVHPFSTAEISTASMDFEEAVQPQIAAVPERESSNGAAPPEGVVSRAAVRWSELESGDGSATGSSEASEAEKPPATASVHQPLEKMTVKALKQMAKEMGVPSSGRKLELIERIKASLGSLEE